MKVPQNDQIQSDKTLSALDAYINRVYRIIVLIIPIFCICVSITITTLHLTGHYPDINRTALLLFDLSDILYLLIGIYLFHTGFGPDGIVLPAKLAAGKYIMTLILLIQWNAISYLWPFTDFWAFSVLFTIVLALFFDVKLVAFATAGIVFSMVLSWIVKGSRLLPPNDDYFVANMTFRIVGLSLMLFSINLITFFGGKFLVEELEKYVNYDPLTHLLNRRSMDNYLQEAHRMAKTGMTPFCLLMMDIDDFKLINDTWGHECGDEVLRGVAKIVSSSVGKDDCVFRWGGEEILILLKADEIIARRVAERIRIAIQKNTFEYNRTRIGVTITIGISAYSPEKGIQDMMNEADKKLYDGKRSGKNQVVF